MVCLRRPGVRGRNTRTSRVDVRTARLELLRYLASIMLYPGTEIAVIAVAPFGGPLTIRVGKTEYPMGRELAGHLLVDDTQAKKERQNG